MRGLPSSFNGFPTIVVIDDPSTIQAFQVWTDQSRGTLIDKMVPVVGKIVK
ncbi:hypothetical protein [Nocardia terpenica]|uniref:hypothetical protein n=1 Tax=Nocardia terpenica TaxID=455432 RepID=UPI001EEC722D|nr:hypothetical protein [Nocardia terpenica]